MSAWDGSESAILLALQPGLAQSGVHISCACVLELNFDEKHGIGYRFLIVF